MMWGRNRRIIAASFLAVTAVTTVVLAPAYLLSWSPALHRACTDDGQVVLEGMFFPALVVNSPYGGVTFANVTEELNFPGAWGYPNDTAVLGDSESNGSTGALFFPIDVSIHRITTTLVWGSGQNSPCQGSYSVILDPPKNIGSISWPLLPAGSMNDAGVPTWVNFTGFQGDPTSPIFNDNFAVANRGNVSTCGASAQSLLAFATSVAVRIPFSVGGQNYTLPLTIPFLLSYHYLFPSNFGNWQIDNLSAPGGPGGGWAFSYSPCP